MFNQYKPMSEKEVMDQIRELRNDVRSIKTAILGPEDGSRVGMVGTMLMIQHQWADLEQRTDKLEAKNESEGLRDKLQPAGISAGIIAIVETVKYLTK